jgi:LmbE family N-acetylglucosaminyl deacetylase
VPGVPPGVTIHVPDGAPDGVALSRATDLGVVAHPDDLELLLAGPLVACGNDPLRSFVGVVVTNGAGSVRSAGHADLDDTGFVAVRAAEQRRAADAAGMGAVVLVGRPSDDVRTPGPARDDVVATITALVRATQPTTVHTHDPADAHTTHVAVTAAVIDALRQLPRADQPAQVLGWEGWRSLSWLPDDRRHHEDLSGRAAQAMDLARHHASQLGPKRYDEAVPGRWRANATFMNPRGTDEATDVALAWDLTAAIDPAADPAGIFGGTLQQFTAEVTARWSTWW